VTTDPDREHETVAASTIKSAEEIELVRQASRIVSDVLALLRDQVVEGTTTTAMDRLAEEFIRDHGAEPAFKGYVVQGEAYPSTLCTSVNSAVVHGLPDDRPLAQGDLLSIDVGVRLAGYYGDSAATYPVGEVSDEARRLMQATEDALWLGIAQAVDGNRVYDISRAVQRHVEANGFSIVRELVGHGIGKRLHEEPSIPNFLPSPFARHQFRNAQLIDGMTICIEPMVNAGTYRVATLEDRWTVVTADGRLSAHYEHTVVIRPGRAEVLTSWPSPNGRDLADAGGTIEKIYGQADSDQS